MLVLFDIDATLIKTSRAGLYAMQDAIQDVFDAPCELGGINFAGRLDPLILRDILAHNGHPSGEQARMRVATRYRDRLEERLSVPGTGVVLPGVDDLIKSLETLEAVTLGLLTGNFAETGRMKLRACGLDPTRFLVNAFGDDSPHDPPSRRHLPPVAMARFEQHHGRPVPPHHTTIIGDTPNDVDCARANGCRAIAVASGVHDFEDLEGTKPDLCLHDLTETDRIVSWITDASDEGNERRATPA